MYKREKLNHIGNIKRFIERNSLREICRRHSLLIAIKSNPLRGILRRSFLLIFPLLTLSTLQSCSTQKAKWINIQYHNITCHYNTWWNGNESLKAGRLKLKKQAVDDYTQIIPVENIGSDELSRSLNPEFDRAIEKGVKGIKEHSIFVKGEEHVPYIKECYLLTAYATFYKHDYVSTTNTCNILISQFSGTRAGDEGAVLLARCLTMEKQYSEAEAALAQLVRNLDKGNFSRSQRVKLYLAMVEATVPQEKYKKAVEYIHLALDASPDSYTRARINFIMAQIYRKLDKRSVASKYYGEVLSCHPPYVMEFNAKLGEASCADLEHADIAKLERRLDDMLSDKKNEEYRDQIYFAKGEMYLGVKQPQKACDNYRLSVAAATVNKAQKAQSALRMGEVLYDVFEDYDQAQLYYDTAMQVIGPDYPNYPAIRRRYDMLSELVSFTRVYTRCDSLKAVAAMTDAERMELINGKIEALKKQEEEAKEKELLEELLNDARAQQNTLTGDWYFYNPQTVQKGKETFRQRWGQRILEDLWFLSNKNMLASLNFGDDSNTDDDSDTTTVDDTLNTKRTTLNAQNGDPNDPHSPAYYLKDLPTSPQQFDSIDSLTSVSLLGAGYIFYDGIHNIPRALECYHRLASDYTSHPEIVQAFYMLYRIYDRQGNTPQANYYRDMVLMGFPDCDFANLIRDNEYYKELLRRERVVEADYEEMYSHYVDGRYTAAVAIADRAEENYPGNPMLNKFRYFKALSLAKKGFRTDAVNLLRPLAALPEKDSIQPLAQAQLALLQDSTFDFNSEEILDRRVSEKTEHSEMSDSQTSKQPSNQENVEDDALPPESQVYRYRENQQHFIVIVVDERTVRATELQRKIVEFNNVYYSNAGLKVNTSLFTDTTQIITIHRFVNGDAAMNYWNHLQQEESPLHQLAEKDHVEFPITSQNYATFYNRKDPAAYLPFFKKYYIDKRKK